MNKTKWYQKTVKKEMVGLLVRTTQELSTGVVKIPVGKILKIDGKQNGLHLISEPCGCCGVRVYVRKVSPSRTSYAPNCFY
jgi:hypothetical protein